MSDLNFDSAATKRRLEALSDGIFAITMTMMILDLKIPESSVHNMNPSELNDALFSLLPSIKSYVISFFILGIFWLRQQIQLSFFNTINKYSIIIYILFLLLIGFVPFTVNLIKRYPDYHSPFILYSLNLFLLSIILFLNSYLISKSRDLKDDSEESNNGKKFMRFSGITAVIFLIGFIVSFINVEVAFYIIILDPLFFFVYRRFGKIKT